MKEHFNFNLTFLTLFRIKVLIINQTKALKFYYSSFDS